MKKGKGDIGMSEENTVLPQNKRENVLFIVLLSGLLFLRFPLLLLSSFQVITLPKTMMANIVTDGTYLLTALLIILKRDSLSDYNMGFFALAIFMIAPVAELIFQYAGAKYMSFGFIQTDLWFRIAVSLGLLIVLLIYRPALRKRSAKEILLWSLIAVAVGVGSGIFTGKMAILQGGQRIPGHAPAIIVITSFFTQLGNAAVIEEPLFRGFLWGWLNKLHWKGHWIWLTQAGLFWLGHIYYVGFANFSFWILVPVAGLVLGALVWRSKSIGTSMIAHGLINSMVGDVIARAIW